jgi:hypothetical protein
MSVEIGMIQIIEKINIGWGNVFQNIAGSVD